MTINEIMEREIDALDKLNSLLDFEKEALIYDKGEELTKIIEEKKISFKEISLIERERIDLFKDKVASDFVLEGIVEKEKLDKLQKTVEDIKAKQETNMILTKQSIYYIRTITNTMSTSEASITYSNKGQVGEGISSSVFTTKA